MKIYFYSVFVLSQLLLRTASAQSQDECRNMDHRSCLNSTVCIIDNYEDRIRNPFYECRIRRAPCELNLPTKGELRSIECEKRSGCAMSGRCYCPCEDPKHPKYRTCNCECGGGLPLDCRSIKEPPKGIK